MCDCEALLDVCEQCFDPLLRKIGRQEKKEAPTIECVRTLLSEEEQEKEGFLLVVVAVAAAAEETALHPSGSNGISFVEEYGSIGFETSFDDESSLRNSKDCCCVEEENFEGQQDANDESQSLTKEVSENDSEVMSHVKRGGAPSKGEAMGGGEAITVCEAVCDGVVEGAVGEAIIGNTVGVAVGEAVCEDYGDAVVEALDEAMGEEVGAVVAAGVTTKSDERGMIRGETHIVEQVSEQESESGDEETNKNMDTSDDDASMEQREQQIEEMRAHVEMRLESLLKSNALVGLREQVQALRKSGLESESVVHKEEVFTMGNQSFEEENVQESSTIIESSDPHDREKSTAFGNPEACRVHSEKHDSAENSCEEANCGIQCKNGVGGEVGNTIGVAMVEAVGEGAGDAVGEHAGDEESDGRGVAETETHFDGKVSDVVSALNEKNGYETELKEEERYSDRSETYISGHASVDEKNSTQSENIAADVNPAEGHVHGEKPLSAETVSEQDGYEKTLEKEHDDGRSKNFFSGNASVDKKNGTASKKIATDENPTGEQEQDDGRSATSFSGNASVDHKKNGNQKTNPASFFQKAAEAVDCPVAQNKGFIKRPYLILLFHSLLSVVLIAFSLWNR